MLVSAFAPSPKRDSAAPIIRTDPSQLVREVIDNEIGAETKETNLWSYRELTKHDGKTLLLQYCQTRYGTMHRLLSVNGNALGPKQSEVEDKRIRRMIRSPETIREAQKKETADAQEERKFLKLFPEALQYQIEGQQGDRVKLRFSPNPGFSPAGMEERALHALTGTMVVDAKQKRLVSVNGRLLTEVKFLGGFLGHLDPGGTFSVTLENVAPGDWELKSLDVQMNGKALLFKTIAVREQESYSDYAPVPPNTSLVEAAARLKTSPAS